jgi:hypothetical protein
VIHPDDPIYIRLRQSRACRLLRNWTIAASAFAAVVVIYQSLWS